MSKAKAKSPQISANTTAQGGTPLTEEKFQYYFENIKDLIVSSAKSTEQRLITIMDEKFEMTWAAISEHTRLIKGLTGDVNTLQGDVKGLKDDVKVLKDDVKVLKDDVKVLKDDVKVLKDDVKEIRTDMRHMEERLSAKIDGNATRLDDHEVRITKIERCA